LFILSPSHIQLDVSVSPRAALSNPDVSIFNGFQYAIAPAAFQITPQLPALPEAIPTLTNAAPGLTGAYPGAIVTLYGSNLTATTATPVISIGGQSAGILYAGTSQINLQVPTGLTPGPALLNLNNGATSAFPVLVNIDTLPAGINAIQNSAGNYIDTTHAAHQGDLLIVTLSNFAPAGTTVSAGSVQVGVAGVLHNAIQVNSPAAGIYQVSFLLNANEQVGQSQQLVVYLNGRSSYPATIPVATPSGAFVVGSQTSGN